MNYQESSERTSTPESGQDQAGKSTKGTPRRPQGKHEWYDWASSYVVRYLEDAGHDVNGRGHWRFLDTRKYNTVSKKGFIDQELLDGLRENMRQWREAHPEFYQSSHSIEPIQDDWKPPLLQELLDKVAPTMPPVQTEQKSDSGSECPQGCKPCGHQMETPNHHATSAASTPTLSREGPILESPQAGVGNHRPLSTFEKEFLLPLLAPASYQRHAPAKSEPSKLRQGILPRLKRLTKMMRPLFRKLFGNGPRGNQGNPDQKGGSL